MLIEIIINFLLQIARFLSCEAFLCAVVQLAAGSFAVVQTSYAIPHDRVIPNTVRYAAAVGDETAVVTYAVGNSSDRAVYRKIERFGPGPSREPEPVRIPFTPHTTWTAEPDSDAFVVTGTDWWYATLDERGGDKEHGGTPQTTFVKSDGSRVTYAKVPIEKDPSFSGPPQIPDFTESRSWRMTAVPGEKPRVLELTLIPDVETLVQEVDWKGPSKSWQLPPVSYKHRLNSVAQPLPDGRIALFVSDGGLSMYELADDGTVDAIPLRNVVVDYFDAVVDGGGRVAIVAAHNLTRAVPNDTGSVDVAVFDWAHPDRVQWQPIRHDVSVEGDFKTTHIVPTSDGYAAAWVNALDKSRIEAAAIDARGHAGPVVVVGHAAARGKGAFLNVQSRGDDVLFWWDDEVRLFQRRLPASFAGFAAIQELAPLCSDKPHAATE